MPKRVDANQLEIVRALREVGATVKLDIAKSINLCYTSNCRDECYTGRFAFPNAINPTQYFIVGKAPRISGLTSRHSSRQRWQASAGRFVLWKKSAWFAGNLLRNMVKGFVVKSATKLWRPRFAKKLTQKTRIHLLRYRVKIVAHHLYTTRVSGVNFVQENVSGSLWEKLAQKEYIIHLQK